jgi:HEAT repeat protein
VTTVKALGLCVFLLCIPSVAEESASHTYSAKKHRESKTAVSSSLIEKGHPFSEPSFSLEQFGSNEKAIEHISQALKQHPFLQCSKEGKLGSLRDEARAKLLQLAKDHPESYGLKLVQSDAERAFTEASKHFDLKALDDVAFHYPHTPQAKEAISSMIGLYLDANEFTLASLLADKLVEDNSNLNVTDYIRMMVSHCRTGEFKKANDVLAIISDPSFKKTVRETEMVDAVDQNCKANRLTPQHPPSIEEVLDMKSPKVDHYLRAIRLIGGIPVLSRLGVPPPYLKEACFIVQAAVLEPKSLPAPTDEQVKTLSLFGDRSLPIFVEVMRSSEGDTGRQAILAMGPKAIKPLLEAFGDADFPEPVVALIHLLGPKAMVELGKKVNDPNPFVRKRVSQAYRAAAHIISETDIEPLLQLSGDPDENIRENVIPLLISREDLAPTLIRGLGDASPYRRQSAAQLLGLQLATDKTGYDTKEANDAIRQALGDSAPDVRKVLIGSLLKKKDRVSFIPDFVRLLDDTEEDVRDMASRFLRDLGGVSVAPLIEATKSGSNISRHAATRTLSLFKHDEERLGKTFLTPAAHDRLHELAEDSDPDVRLSAIASFYFSKSPRPLAIKSLIKGLESTLPQIQFMSMEVLADHPEAKEALPQLEKLKKSKVAHIRESAEGLSEIIRGNQ